MERRNYILPFKPASERQYVVIAYDGRYGVPGKGNHLPIKINGSTCKRDGKEIALAEFIYSSPKEDMGVDAEFLRERIDILYDRHPDWILGEFEILMTGIVLKYYNMKRDVDEEIYLHVSSSSNVHVKLHIEFSVPHTNGKPGTVYWFQVEASGKYAWNNFVLLEKMGQDSQSCIAFRIDETKHDPLILAECDIIEPDYADVTEYIDI